MRYAFYPGCSLHSTAPQYASSIDAVSEALGIDLIEIPDWTCCGATAAHSTSEMLALALPARNFAFPQEQNLEIVTPCASCFSRLKLTSLELEANAELRSRVNATAGTSYDGKAGVKHLLYAMPEPEISKKVSRPLSGLTVVCYYGCLLTRPPGVSSEQDVENPQAMDRIMTALGAKVVDWGFKTECCGASLSITNTPVAVKLCRDILREAAQAGADCIVAACPLCHMNLDMRQEDTGIESRIPVVYFTQLMGLAFGLDHDALGLERHFVSAAPLLGRL